MAAAVSNHALRHEVLFHRNLFIAACVITTVAMGMLTASLLMHPTTACLGKIQAVLFVGSFFPVGFIGLGLMLQHGCAWREEKKLLKQKELEC